MSDSIQPNIASLEHDVEARSASLKKELGLFDLVLTQVVFVVGTIWVGWAAKLGYQQNVFWILAIITFYVPLAVVVIFLNKLLPLEGGLYQWAKAAFGDLVAFMVAWNLWVFAILIASGIGLVVTTNISYAIGERAAWMRSTKWLITLISCLLVFGMIAAATRGLGIGKWVHNAGGVMLMMTFVVLLALPLFAIHPNDYRPFAIQIPTLSMMNVNVYSKLALGALTGFEYIAILAGETRAPARNIGRSVIIAAPIIAIMFILGTSTVLAFVSPDKVDLIGPIPQVLSIGFSSYGWVGKVVSIAILGVVVRQIALMSIYFTANTRLPMVAGWDRLLPAWFTRLHRTYRTPVNSILVVGAVTLAFGLASLIGVGEQEAFQLLDNAGGVFYATTYVVLFAIPLFGMRAFGIRAPWWLQIACASGLLVSLLYIGFTIVPIIAVGSRLTFALKIVAVVIVANALGFGIFALGHSRSRLAADAS
ncbi:MAG TPA: APC family permease [Pyrinomonadaceae bacterium]|nr:APC family permease [Pyrinomonadaceae bacterium]